ncbi:MAG TPA: hypothetical protein DCY51_00460 [Bacteroidetes bacterium]|nr:hypothetical protein [Bacteroidota bacterium]
MLYNFLALYSWCYKSLRKSSFMINRLKSIKKSTLVILTLIVLNIVAFTLLSSNIKQNYRTTDTISTSVENNNYFKAGVNVLDWSYSLLRYFRR